MGTIKYDRELIIRTLKAWNFDLKQLDINRIEHVPMHEYRISKEEKDLLYVDNLQCCVCLYAYGNNFSFATHINPVVFENDEYLLDENKQPIHLNRVDDLINSIITFSKNNEITKPFKIGISFGVPPLSKYEKSILLIYKGLEQIIIELTNQNIPGYLEEDLYEPDFIIDTPNKKLILPKQKVK